MCEPSASEHYKTHHEARGGASNEVRTHQTGAGYKVRLAIKSGQFKVKFSSFFNFGGTLVTFVYTEVSLSMNLWFRWRSHWVKHLTL